MIKIIKTAMSKKFFHILIVVLLVLNLTGIPAFSFTADCGMDCCRPAHRAGTVSFEAASCCNMDGVTCGFEAGQWEELFDTAVCSSNSVNSTTDGIDILSFTVSYLVHSHLRTYPPTFVLTGSPPTVPVFLANSAILC